MTSPMTTAVVAPLMLSTVELRYPELYRVYTELSDREKTTLEAFEKPIPDGVCTEIMRIDFTQPLSPLPASYPMKTNSDANKFAMFVWNLLSACESGSIGGDACRMMSVLIAATNDTLSSARDGSVLARFQHLLGLTLAISNHGVGSWLERGDEQTGKKIFKALGDAWKRIFDYPGETVMSAPMRKFATDACEMLQRMLKASRRNHGPYAAIYSFNYMVQKRAAKPDAPAAGSSSAGDSAAPAPPTSKTGGKRKATPSNEEPTTPAAVPQGLKQDLAARVVAAIKRTEHTERGRPYTTVEASMGPEIASALLPGLKKVSFEGAAAVLTFLPLPKTLHPVRNRIRTILAGPDDDGFVYSWAGYESLDVSYVKSSQTLKLKVRTLLVGGGVPRAYKDGEKHFDGYVACKTLPELRKWIEEKQFE